MLASPCINLCQMDAQSRLCRGCFRSIDEITGWAGSDDARRAIILAAVALRRQDAVVTTPVAAPSGWHDN